MSFAFFKQSSLLSPFVDDGTAPRSKEGKSRIDFASLGDDIHHIILTELFLTSSSSLPSLALTSKAWNAITTPYLYRNVVLSGADPKHDSCKRRAANAFVSRLRENRNNITKHIRRLRVEQQISTRELEEILDHIENLRVFSWNVNTKIPPSIIEKLQTRWPSVKISVRNHERNEKYIPGGNSIDTALLSLPQLASLDYSIFVDDDGTGNSYSEWPQITRALVAGGNCKSLRLKIIYAENQFRLRDKPEHAGPTQFRLNPGDKLPPLEELSFTREIWAPEYVFDAAHCSLLRDSMDWSLMRKLDFGDDCPFPLFNNMIGYMPNLNSLRIGMPRIGQSLGWLPTFLDSLKELRELDIGSLVPHVHEFWPHIRNHKASLETLILRPSRGEYGSSAYIDVGYWEEVATDFPHLRHVGIDVPFVRGDSKSEGESMKFQDAYIASIMGMELKALTLFLHLPTAGSAFAPRYMPDVTGMAPFPDLNVKGCKISASAIAETFSAGKARQLQNLSIQFIRTCFSDRGQIAGFGKASMQLRRNERDDADRLDIREQWSVSGSYKWSW